MTNAVPSMAVGFLFIAGAVLTSVAAADVRTGVTNDVFQGQSAGDVLGGSEGIGFVRTERNKWRVAVGPAFNFGVRSRLSFKTGAAASFASRYLVTQSSTGTGSRQAALDRMTGAADPNGVKRYEGGAWVDPQDSAPGDDGTWNFAVPSAAAVIRDGLMTLRSAGYSETTVTPSAGIPSVASVSDDCNAPGLNLDLSRELYYDPDWHWGLDLALGFSWFFHKSCFRGGGEIYRQTDTTVTRTGYFTERFDISEWQDPDGDYPFCNGVLGSGSFAGPGPVLAFKKGKVDEIFSETSSEDIHSVSAFVRGDYNEFELTAALRPFYEPCDWLRLYGTLGVGVSYLRLSYRESLAYNGKDVYDTHRTENDFAVFGLAGLGAQVNYKQFLLGFDFNARFLANDADMDSELVDGCVSRGGWYFRLLFGFEF